jgi:hypothetical protein
MAHMPATYSQKIECLHAFLKKLYKYLCALRNWFVDASLLNFSLELQKSFCKNAKPIWICIPTDYELNNV